MQVRFQSDKVTSIRRVLFRRGAESFTRDCVKKPLEVEALSGSNNDGAAGKLS